jgi:hypothetical protein
MTQGNLFVCVLLKPFLNLLRRIGQAFVAAPEEDRYDHLNINISTR